MIYRGKEKSNHRGSIVKYRNGDKWYTGVLLEPVNYQIVVTREHGLVILSAGNGDVEMVQIIDGNHITDEEAERLLQALAVKHNINYKNENDSHT